MRRSLAVFLRDTFHTYVCGERYMWFLSLCVWGDTCETRVCIDTQVCGPRQDFGVVLVWFGVVSEQVHTLAKRVLW